MQRTVARSRARRRLFARPNSFLPISRPARHPERYLANPPSTLVEYPHLSRKRGFYQDCISSTCLTFSRAPSASRPPSHQGELQTELPACQPICPMTNLPACPPADLPEPLTDRPVRPLTLRRSHPPTCKLIRQLPANQPAFSLGCPS